jgi:hypothetical protein
MMSQVAWLVALFTLTLEDSEGRRANDDLNFVCRESLRGQRFAVFQGGAYWWHVTDKPYRT